MNRFAIALILPLALILSAAPVYASFCLDNNTLMENFTVSGSIMNLTFTCAHGCVNDACAGTDSQVDMQSMWLIWAVGTSMLIIAVVMGIPTGQLPENSGLINLRAIMRYMFFFVGLMFIYFAFGTARGIVNTYGGSEGATSAAETATMVCLWTFVIFIFMFVIELIFSITSWLVEQGKLKKQRKWGGREL